MPLPLTTVPCPRCGRFELVAIGRTQCHPTGAVKCVYVARSVRPSEGGGQETRIGLAEQMTRRGGGAEHAAPGQDQRDDPCGWGQEAEAFLAQHS